jgi:hypothetical protein
MRIAAHCLKKDYKHYNLIVNEEDFKTFESILNKLRFSDKRNKMIKSFAPNNHKFIERSPKEFNIVIAL